MYETFHDLILGYLDTLKGRHSYINTSYVVAPWILTLDRTPTRQDILARHRAKGIGHCQAGATAANSELKVMRAAFRWGTYQEVWTGGDPTFGIKPWKTPGREEILKHQQIATLLTHFRQATTDTAIRDRALFGLCLFTGSRPIEGRTALLTDIDPYGTMGCWKKAKTKNGKRHQIPIPSQLMGWLEDWKSIRPTYRPNPYLFPGQGFNKPLGAAMMVWRWDAIRTELKFDGLWNYDLRRTLVCYLSDELGYDSSMIRAILNHKEKGALGHYLHKSFDSLTKPIQHYADWLWGLSGAPSLPPPAALSSDARRLGTLSKREREVLSHFAQGDSSCRRIAAQLKISCSAVESYRSRLSNKLQLKTSIELIHFARAHEGEATVSIPNQAPPPPVVAPVVMDRPVMHGPVQTVHLSRWGLEREEWPG